MTVSAAIEFTPENRRLIARFLGKDGMASHIECVAWMKAQVRSSLVVLAEAERQKATALLPLSTRPIR